MLLKVCSQATGDLYGAVFLDQAFEQKVKSMIGDEAFKSLSTRNRKKMMSDWEFGIKRTFKHGHSYVKNWIIDVPGYAGLPSHSASVTAGATAAGKSFLGHQRTPASGRKRKFGEQDDDANVPQAMQGEPGVLNLKT